MNGVDFTHINSVEGVDVSGRRVLVRVDLNVPVRDGMITDTTRIDRILPTISSLLSRGAKVIILSHFGRPGGRRAPGMSLRPVAEKMDEMLEGHAVRFVEDCIGPRAEAEVSELADGQIILLQNLRFHPGEEANCITFARSLSVLGDIFINDAFSTSHRAHASTHAVTTLLPSFAGPLMMAEIEALCTVLDKPEKPVVAVVGGAKISTKLPILTNLITKVDSLIIGGAMANTFLYAQGHGVGSSLCEPELATTVTDILAVAREARCNILLPSDVVVAKELRANAACRTCDVDTVGPDEMILDTGPATLDGLKRHLAACRTLLWNGPLGAFEFEPFGRGTFQLAQEAAQLSGNGKLTSVAGGGDTVAALNAAGVTQDFTYISTAGGAFLEWLEGRELPGVMALVQNQEHQLARSA